MGRINRAEASEPFEAPGLKGHYTELGGYTIGFESYSAEQDLAPAFVGLPVLKAASRSQEGQRFVERRRASLRNSREERPC